MVDVSSTEQSPHQAWSRLVEATLRGSATRATAAAPPGRSDDKDPWGALAERLWEANPFTRLVPIDPGEVTRAFQQVWLDALRRPDHAWATYTDFVQQYTRLMAASALKFWAGGQGVAPVAAPEKDDRRFSAPDWQRNAVFDALKQSYLLAATTMLKTAADVEGLDQRQQRRLVFYLRQFLDAISPTNFVFTNPQVIHEALESGGQSLATGMQHLLRDVAAGQVKMTDTDAFEPGRNLALTPGQVIYRNKLIELIQYAPTTDNVHAIPLLFIPPWINKYYILDMQPQNSLIRFLVEQGFTVFVISWKNPDASMEETGFEDYLDLGPLAALDVVKEITGSSKVKPVGYCIGGTLLSMALPYLAAKGDESVDAAIMFVALQDFSEVGDTAVFMDEPQVAYVEEQMMERGYLDSRQMASMFNMLRANDLIWSNVVNNYLLGKEPPAFDLLYWNADGTRMARAAHSFYLRNTYLENNLVKPNRIVLKGIPIDLGAITQDLYAVGAEQDHIVPWRAAWQISRLAGGKVRYVLAASGHIAGIISPPSKGRGYWTSDKPAESAEQWLEVAERRDGSWWTDWIEWLRPRSGKQVAPPSLGSATHPPIVPAPGTYVLEK
jgi:polyhydroxyalkanoate synthase subunit PhaC